MKRILFVLTMASTVGCSTGMSAGDGMVLAGSPEAIQSFGDMINGVISNTKSLREDGDSSHWQHRKQQEQEKTKRLVPSSFWSKLTTPTRKVEQGS